MYEEYYEQLSNHQPNPYESCRRISFSFYKNKRIHSNDISCMSFSFETMELSFRGRKKRGVRTKITKKLVVGAWDLIRSVWAKEKNVDKDIELSSVWSCWLMLHWLACNSFWMDELREQWESKKYTNSDKVWFYTVQYWSALDFSSFNFCFFDRGMKFKNEFDMLNERHKSRKVAYPRIINPLNSIAQSMDEISLSFCI